MIGHHASEDRRSMPRLTQLAQVREAGLAHLSGCTGVPSTLPARQATINCSYADGPCSDERRSFVVIPRFIASALQVSYVGVLESALVAAGIGIATQAMSALVTANVAIRIMLFRRLKGFTASS